MTKKLSTKGRCSQKHIDHPIRGHEAIGRRASNAKQGIRTRFAGFLIFPICGSLTILLYGVNEIVTRQPKPLAAWTEQSTLDLAETVQTSYYSSLVLQLAQSMSSRPDTEKKQRVRRELPDFILKERQSQAKMKMVREELHAKRLQYFATRRKRLPQSVLRDLDDNEIHQHFPLAGIEWLTLFVEKYSFNGTTADQIDEIFQHGCWCPRLVGNGIGGPATVSELDDLCRSWFSTHSCNTNILGGSCYDVTISANKTYTYTEQEQNVQLFDTTLLEKIVGCFQPWYTDSSLEPDPCAQDTCKIDRHYTSLIIQLLDSVGGKVANLEQQDSSTCIEPISINPNVIPPGSGHTSNDNVTLTGVTPAYCHGVAPDLVKMPPITIDMLKNVCVDPIDILYVMDGSGSVTDANFEVAMRFFYNLTEPFEISEDVARIAFIQFGYQPQLEFPFLTNRTEILAALAAVEYLAGPTFTGLALELALDVFTQHGNPGARKAVVVLTDGMSYDNVGDPAELLYAAGIDIFVVGVGEAYTIQLQEIASDPDSRYLFQLGDAAIFRYELENRLPSSSFAALDDIRFTLMRQICA